MSTHQRTKFIESGNLWHTPKLLTR